MIRGDGQKLLASIFVSTVLVSVS